MRSPRYAPLVTVVCAIVAGIVLDRYASEPVARFFRPTAFALWWCLAACSLIVWWLTWRRRLDALSAFPLLAAAALTAAGWHQARWQLFDRHELARYADNESAPACVLVVAREMPERVPAPRPTPLRAIPGNERSRLLVEVTAIRDGTKWRPARGICQLSVEGHLLGIHTGDRLRVYGQLSRLRPPLNPGEFDFAAHARADRRLTHLRSSAPESVNVTNGLRDRRGGDPASWLEAVRRGGQRLVRDFVGPERAALASAILLGAREGLPNEETNSYFVTGTIHLLVVSGLHVGILALGLYSLMRAGLLSRRTSLAVIIGVVVLYALVAEARPPVVRAAVLTVLVCLAAWNGRRATSFNSLAAAALVVLALNPAELFRVGTQLSFLAVATLVWNERWSPFGGRPGDRLDRLVAASRPRYVRLADSFWRWNIWLLVTTAVVWLTALPLVLYRFNIVTPAALVISPAVWLLIFAALWSGFMTLVFGWLAAPVGEALGAVCDASLAGLEGVVQWAESMPGGHFWSPGPAGWWVLGFYLGLMLVILRGRTLVPRRWQLAALCAWIVVGIVPAIVRPWTRDALECSFVAVGHGACVVLEVPTGETVVYDAGALGSPEFATRTIASCLWDRGIRRIDGLVISHADVDHYNAVPGLLERFRVGAVYVSPLMFDGIGGTGRGPDVLREAIRTAGVPIREIWSGDRLRVGPELTLEVLHPPRQGVLGSDNANSVTLAVEYGGRRLLVPGDLESPGLEDLLAELPYDCDILLAPHHGSQRSDPPGLAAWSSPEWVVISGAERDAVLPVVQTYEDSGATVFQTDLRGRVRFSIRPDHIEAATWLAGGE